MLTWYEYMNKQAASLSKIQDIVETERQARRMNLANSLGSSFNKPLSENLGEKTSKILPILLGITMGAQSEDKPALMSLVGGIVGYGISKGADKLGGLIGRYKKLRTLEDQEKYEKSNVSGVLNYMIPGMGVYNKERSMRLAYSNDVHDKRNS